MLRNVLDIVIITIQGIIVAHLRCPLMQMIVQEVHFFHFRDNWHYIRGSPYNHCILLENVHLIVLLLIIRIILGLMGVTHVALRWWGIPRS